MARPTENVPELCTTVIFILLKNATEKVGHKIHFFCQVVK